MATIGINEPKIELGHWFDKDIENDVRFYINIFENSKLQFITHFREESPLPGVKEIRLSFEIKHQSLIRILAEPATDFVKTQLHLLMAFAQKKKHVIKHTTILLPESKYAKA